MGAVLSFLDDAVPEMQETRLLRDAIAALDEAFLVVVVGEFNSGKSSVINALLGERLLEDGILPTTNEISVLKYAADGEASTSTVCTVHNFMYRQTVIWFSKLHNILLGSFKHNFML